MALVACIEPNRGLLPDLSDETVDLDVDSPEVAQADLDGPETDAVPPDDVDETDIVSDDAEVPDARPDDVANTELPCLPVGCDQADLAACKVKLGWCLIGGACREEGDLNPGNTCQECNHAVDTLGWTLLLDLASCDDGLSCTKNDVCRGGVCRDVVDCAAPASCVSVTCDPLQNACVNKVEEGCFISNTCYSDEDFAADGCGSCQPDENECDWTLGDPSEPDNTYDNAHRVPSPIVDWSAGQFQPLSLPWTASRISPADDVDVFRFDLTGPTAARTRTGLRPIPAGVGDQVATSPRLPTSLPAGSLKEKGGRHWVPPFFLVLNLTHKNR